MKRKQACTGRGRPRKNPNVVSERVVSERVVSERVVNERENAFLNFVSHNVEEGNNILEHYKTDDEDCDDEEFNPELEIDSGSNSSSMGSDWSDGDQNVSSLDRTVQNLLKRYGEVNHQMANSSKQIDGAQVMPLAVSGSRCRFQNEQESPTHEPCSNKKELGAALVVIRKVMKMDAAVPFNIPVDPIALRLPVYKLSA